MTKSDVSSCVESIDSVYVTQTNTENLSKDIDIETLDQRPYVDEIPDKFSGWGLCAVIAVGIFSANSWGSNAAYALYLQHYLSDDIFPGADKYDFGIIGGLTFGAGLAFAPLINLMVGKFGYKPVVAVGILIQLAGTLLASFSTELWQIYCTQGLMTGIGLGVLFVPVLIIVPQWFKGGPGGKRNLALGLVASGSGMGGVIYNIGLSKLLKEKSFRWSLRAQAIMCFGLNIIAFFLIKSRNAHIKPSFKVYDRLVWHCFGYLCMVIWIIFTLFGYIVLMYNLGDFTRSLGYSSNDSSIVSTMVAVGIIYGRPLVGLLGDIIGPINVTIIASWIVAILTWAMWIPCRNLPTAIVFALLVGSLMGTIWLTMATISASIVGLKKLGVAMAICWSTTGIFGFVSPIIGLSLKKNGPTSPTQYQPAAIFVGLSYFVAGLSLYVLRAWVINRNEKLEEDDDDDQLLMKQISASEVIQTMIHPSLQKV